VNLVQCLARGVSRGWRIHWFLCMRPRAIPRVLHEWLDAGGPAQGKALRSGRARRRMRGNSSRPGPMSVLRMAVAGDENAASAQASWVLAQRLPRGCRWKGRGRSNANGRVLALQFSLARG
jgi:hypothetical protein